jgi:hypothetical protein
MSTISDNGTTGAVEPDPQPDGDVVAAVVERVRADLAARRARGELPSLPDGELGRQFDAVVEATETGLVEELPVHTEGLADAGRLPSWRPAPVGNPVRRVLALLLRFPAKVLGLFVRRQVEEFAFRTTVIVEELAIRQNRIQRFLARAHLDRIRTLEYRVARLEEELVRLRAEGAGAQGGGPGDVPD